jgi:hypothetical protein
MDRLRSDRDQEITDLRETEAEIQRTRARLSASLGALREEISDLTDWRSWLERQPLPFIAGAFALGFLVGWSTSGRGR